MGSHGCSESGPRAERRHALRLEILTIVGFLLVLLLGPDSCPAASGSVTSESAALRISRDLVTRVASSGRSDLVDLRQLRRADVREWFLVHHPVTLEPVYGLVPIRAEGDHLLGVIAVDAAAERWLWVRFVSADRLDGEAGLIDGEFPAVSVEQARERAREHARAARETEPVEAALLIEGCDKHLYWQFAAARGEKWLIAADRAAAPVLSSREASAARVLAPSAALAEQRQKSRRRSELAPPAEDPRSALRPLPGAYRIPGVPYHYQITSWYCGPASLQMVMNHWGQEIGQVPISDVANDVEDWGCYADDMDRAAHFSGMSTAIQDPTLRGYDERKLGYACVEYSWGSHPDRYGAVRSLVCSHYPLYVLTWYSSTHSAGHFRLVTGYDDNLDVFIMHDPWYSGTYTGPDLLVNQTVFVEDWWHYSWCWGMVATPWLLHPDIPSAVAVGDTFSVALAIHYPGPRPELENRDPCSSCVATIELPAGLSLASGTATQPLASLASGDSTVVSWEVVADGPTGDFGVSFQAQGLVTGSSTSYPSYTDSIGGHGYEIVSVGTTRLDGWDDELRLTNDVASSQTCRPGGRAVAIGPGGTAHLVWADTRDGNSEIYYRSRSATVWGVETRVTNDASYSASPAVACDEAGNVHLAWVDDRDGNHEVYYKWLGSTGWSAAERVTTSGGSSSVDFWPSIAAGGGGVYLAWEGHPSVGMYNMFTVFFSAREDTGWTDPVNVDESIWKSSFRPSLAWGADGLLHIVYEHDAATMEEQKIRHRSWDGSSWSAFTALATATSYSRGPVIAAGADSSLHVVWQDGENVGGDIYYATYDGSVWQPTVPIVTGSGEVATPSVAVEPGGNVHVVWEDNRYAEPEIFLKTASGGTWSDEIRLSAAAGASMLPGIAAGSLGQVCVAWTDLRDGNAEVYFRGTEQGGSSVGDRPVATRYDGPVYLSPPHPLPFVTETRFTFSLPVPTDVSLAIYDLAGRRVKTLASGVHAAGTHALRWDGRNASGSHVSPGLYFIRCATPQGQDVRRVVLLR